MSGVSAAPFANGQTYRRIPWTVRSEVERHLQDPSLTIALINYILDQMEKPK
jgi:hypothetical protein